MKTTPLLALDEIETSQLFALHMALAKDTTGPEADAHIARDGTCDLPARHSAGASGADIRDGDMIKQRIRDALHERAIRLQSRAFEQASATGTPGDKTREWEKLRTLLLHRSPEQVARMERAQFRKLDPHAQQVFLDSKAKQ